MGWFDWLRGGRSPGSSTLKSSGGYRMFTATAADIERVSEEMGEMYFDCPRCGHCARVNNMGKMLLKANPTSFNSTSCGKCQHRFDAGARLKFGACPEA